MKLDTMKTSLLFVAPARLEITLGVAGSHYLNGYKASFSFVLKCTTCALCSHEGMVPVVGTFRRTVLLTTNN